MLVDRASKKGFLACHLISETPLESTQTQKTRGEPTKNHQEKENNNPSGQVGSVVVVCLALCCCWEVLFSRGACPNWRLRLADAIEGSSTMRQHCPIS